MDIWIPIEEQEYHETWDRFYREFDFRPSVYAHQWPSITTVLPQYKFSLAHLWNGPEDDKVYDDFIHKTLQSFIDITVVGEEIYALDWQHACYRINPRNIKAIERMKISFVPDGDYSIFITVDFKNVWFGHPWENKITLIGEKFVDTFRKNLPVFLKDHTL